MRAILKQDNAGLRTTYSVTCGENVTHQCVNRVDGLTRRVDIKNTDTSELTYLIPGPSSREVLRFTRCNVLRRCPAVVTTEDNRECGRLYYTTEKVTFGEQLRFYMTYRGTDYLIDEICLGEYGTKLMIRVDDIIVGLIEKPSKVVDYLDTYEITLEEPDYFDVAVIFTCYYDMCFYVKYLHMDCKSTVRNRKLSPRKYRHLYDPYFKENCSL